MPRLEHFDPQYHIDRIAQAAGGEEDSILNSLMDIKRTPEEEEYEIRKILSTNPLCDPDMALPESLKGRVLVGWEGEDDPKRPRNWGLFRKIMATILISLCTTSMYTGAAIVTAAQGEIQEHFHTTRVKTALDVTLFVWGYGIGSLWFTPMSEIPIFRGRNPTYFFCQLVFACLQIPTALTNHLGAFATLRFLAGIFASPPLSTAGATIGDLWAMPYQIVALIVWAFGAIAGPFLGPLIGAALSLYHPYKYIFWYMLAVSGGMFVLMVFLLPETSEQELLVRKATLRRHRTGDKRWLAPGEVLMESQSAKMILYEMFLKPIKLTAMEPVLLIIDIHMGLTYSVLYLYLEAMPIVYMETYHMNSVQMGLCFMPFLVGAAIGAVLYVSYAFIQADKLDRPELVFGPSATFGSICLPIGLILWGWLSSPHIHWAIGFVGNIFFSIGGFTIFESYFGFMGAMYPANTVGSAFASNNIVRSMMGGAFPLFGTIVYKHTAIDNYPVGWGCSILAFIAILIIPFPIYITLTGDKLRAYAQRKYAPKQPAPPPGLKQEEEA